MKTYAHDPRFIFDGRDGSFPDAVVVREIWCENVYEVFEGDLTDTGIVVDVGANIGSFSLYAAALGAKKVICVEPEPHNIELLVRNIGANKHNVPDCEFVFEERAIIGAPKSHTGYYITDKHGDSQLITAAEARTGDHKNLTEVKTVSLDQLWRDHDLEFVDVLKVDIEGLEGEVLLNASKETLNLCRYITIEYDRRASDLGAIINKLIETHQVKVVGAQGGMIFGKRY